MQSERAPQAMGTMMEMARRMGYGDLMLGTTRMMQMMGAMSGTRGPGGMTQPRANTFVMETRIPGAVAAWEMWPARGTATPRITWPRTRTPWPGCAPVSARC